MGPEEYYHMEDYLEIYPQDWEVLLLQKIDHLPWVLSNHRNGKIRTETIQGLIPLDALYGCLLTLTELEEYEHCEVVWNLILECYPIDVDRWGRSGSFFASVQLSEGT